MSFYSTKILPRILNASMNDTHFEAQRAKTLAGAAGKVLEIGFGTGLNLPHYPAAVKHLTAVEVNPGMEKLARKLLAAAAFPVEFLLINGEQLPLKDQSFDTVVSTWTLCSIDRVEQALSEIRRVLKPEGKFIFVEHGQSPEAKTQRWQHRLNGIQRKMCGNCHLDRSIRSLIEAQGFQIEQLNEQHIEKMPKIVGFFSQGSASRV